MSCAPSGTRRPWSARSSRSPLPSSACRRWPGLLFGDGWTPPSFSESRLSTTPRLRAVHETALRRSPACRSRQPCRACGRSAPQLPRWLLGVQQWGTCSRGHTPRNKVAKQSRRQLEQPRRLRRCHRDCAPTLHLGREAGGCDRILLLLLCLIAPMSPPDRIAPMSPCASPLRRPQRPRDLLRRLQ